MPDDGNRKKNQFYKDTWKKLTSLSTFVFDSFKKTGYSKQILRIGVTECDTSFDFLKDFMNK
jgi:hypothetical protein